MAWERRGNRLFYYRVRRQGGKVIKEYIGTGPAAEAAAQQDADRRAERAKLRQEATAQRKHQETIETLLTDMHIQGDAVLEAALLSAGYYRHDRGKWRKRRG